MRPKNGPFLLKLEPLTCSELVSNPKTEHSELTVQSSKLKAQSSELKNYGENSNWNIYIYIYIYLDV